LLPFPLLLASPCFWPPYYCGLPGVGVPAVAFVSAVARILAVADVLAVAGILAVTSNPADPGVSILVVVFARFCTVIERSTLPDLSCVFPGNSSYWYIVNIHKILPLL
jgi:hypothetical protein